MELAAQLKEMLNEESNKMTSQQTAENIEFSNSDIFTLNSDSALDLSFGGEVETKNQNNFFDFDNSNIFFNLDLENQSTANNLNAENFNLNTENTANLAENADMRAQVVEQFRGEYSPETKEMQIQLKPESLGKIDISLSYDNEQLTGKMLVESEIVRAQLENSLKGLKSDLLKQGINIEQFKIETAKNAPQQIGKQDEFAFDDQNAAFSDGETGQNQEYEQRQFFQGQYYVQRDNGSSNLDSENIIMRQQEMINRAAFSNEKLNLLA
jgi:flagellar hook-length control protein FliK